jgi:hypothetical protein
VMANRFHRRERIIDRVLAEGMHDKLGSCGITRASCRRCSITRKTNTTHSVSKSPFRS